SLLLPGHYLDIRPAVVVRSPEVVARSPEVVARSPEVVARSPDHAATSRDHATPRGQGSAPQIRDRTYLEIDFPDQGQEDGETNPVVLVNRFEDLLLNAVEKRLRADVPVVSYLSGGVDSSIVVAMASKIRGRPIPTFTIRIDDPKLDETSEAAV